MPSHAALTLVLLPLIILTAAQVTQTGPPLRTSVVACFLYPNRPQELGFDYTQNYARLRAYQRLTTAFPQLNLSVIAVFDLLQYECNMSSVIHSIVVARKCEIVICATNQLLDAVNTTSFLAVHSNVRFVEYNTVRYFAEPPQLNYKAIGISMYAAWYAAGAAAGVQCEVCVGFIHPYAQSMSSVNAFYRGMKFGAAQYRVDQRQCPIYAVELGTYYDPPNEMLLADLFVRKGCDVIAYWADSQAISQYVRELRNASIFSVSNNVDASKFWGDSVLTSNFFDMSVVYYQYVQELMENKPLVRKYMTQSNGSDVADISPRAKRNASVAATAAFAQQIANYTVWCGGFISDAGRVIAPPSQCLADQLLVSSTLVELGVVAYPRLVKPTNCGPGTFASYNTSVNFSLTCLACPAGTYSAVSGSMSCSPCAALLEPNSNQSGCVLRVVSIIDPNSDRDVVVAVVVSAGAAFLLVIAIACFARYRKRAMQLNTPLTAPRGPIVGFIALSVDPTRSVPSWRQDLGFACSVFEELAEVVLRSCRVYGGYIIFSAGDSFMIAGPGAEATFELARSIEKHFAEQPTSAKVSLRIVVTAGEPIIVEKQRRAVRQLRKLTKPNSKGTKREDDDGADWPSGTTETDSKVDNAEGDSRTNHNHSKNSGISVKSSRSNGSDISNSSAGVEYSYRGDVVEELRELFSSGGMPSDAQQALRLSLCVSDKDNPTRKKKSSSKSPRGGEGAVRPALFPPLAPLNAEDLRQSSRHRCSITMLPRFFEALPFRNFVSRYRSSVVMQLDGASLFTQSGSGQEGDAADLRFRVLKRAPPVTEAPPPPASSHVATSSTSGDSTPIPSLVIKGGMCGDETPAPAGPASVVPPQGGLPPSTIAVLVETSESVKALENYISTRQKAEAAANKRLATTASVTVKGDAATALPLATPGIELRENTDSINMDDFMFENTSTLLTSSEMMIFFRVGSVFYEKFLFVLDPQARLQMLGQLALRLHLTLDPRKAKWLESDGSKVFFGEDQILREVLRINLLTMDEQELVAWLRSTSETLSLREVESSDPELSE